LRGAKKRDRGAGKIASVHRPWFMPGKKSHREKAGLFHTQKAQLDGKKIRHLSALDSEMTGGEKKKNLSSPGRGGISVTHKRKK